MTHCIITHSAITQPKNLHRPFPLLNPLKTDGISKILTFNTALPNFKAEMPSFRHLVRASEVHSTKV